MVRVGGKADGREDPEAPKTSHAEHLPAATGDLNRVVSL